MQSQTKAGLLPTDPPPYAFTEPDEFDPKSGPAGGTVVIHGKNLATVTSVLFDGVPAPSAQLGANERIVANVPKDARTGPITLDGPRGTIVSRQAFDVILPPNPETITVRPPATGGFVEIFGDHLAEVTSVDFNGIHPPSFTAKRHRLDTTVPPGLSPGLVTVTLTNAAGMGKISYNMP